MVNNLSIRVCKELDRKQETDLQGVYKKSGNYLFKKNPVYKIAKQAKMLKSKVILQNIFFYETYSTACIPHYNPPKSGLSLRVQKIYKDFATMKQKPKN